MQSSPLWGGRGAMQPAGSWPPTGRWAGCSFSFLGGGGVGEIPLFSPSVLGIPVGALQKRRGGGADAGG